MYSFPLALFLYLFSLSHASYPDLDQNEVFASPDSAVSKESDILQRFTSTEAKLLPLTMIPYK